MSDKNKAGAERADVRQWPDNITSGDIRYDASGHRHGGFVLRDVMHGIPVFGSVHVEVFNYPGQTEAIAKALCDRWNAFQPMLEALRYAERRCVSQAAYPHASIEDRTMRDLVVAAIAKAEGRS